MLAASVAALLSLGLWMVPASAPIGEIVIGALLPLTGPAAQVGLEEQNGIEFAVARVNAAGGIRGQKVRVVYEDTQGKPDLGVLGFNRLVDLHKVPSVLTAYSSVSLAIAPIATRRKVLVINPAAQTNKLADASPYLFNTIPLARDEITMIARYAAAKLGKNAAILHENTAVGNDLQEEFKKAFVAAGGTVVADEAVEFGNTNLRPSLLKIIDAKPDFVFHAVTLDAAILVDQLRQHPRLPIGVGNSFFSALQGFKETAGYYQSAVKSTASADTEKEFVARFKTKDMSFYSREYAGGSETLFKLMEQVLGKNLPLNGDTLRAAVSEVKTFDSPGGTFTFDGNTAKRQIDIYRLTPPGRTLVQDAVP
jgi:branched-chain amino acid transport system substrate-binding protein